MTPQGRLTGKQTRRIWRCLDKIANLAPYNQADIKGKVEAMLVATEAANYLKHATYSAIEGYGAEAVNDDLDAAEDRLGLERV